MHRAADRLGVVGGVLECSPPRNVDADVVLVDLRMSSTVEWARQNTEFLHHYLELPTPRSFKKDIQNEE